MPKQPITFFDFGHFQNSYSNAGKVIACVFFMGIGASF